jgi:hypothetical protein
MKANEPARPSKRLQLTESDLRYVVETVATKRQDTEHVVELIRGKPDILEPMLEDPKLAERLLNDEETFARVSPWLFFAVLLRRVQRDVGQKSFVFEIGAAGQRIPIFEAERVAELLAEPATRDYLAGMLAAFTRANTAVVYREEGGAWHQRQFNDIDMDDMIALARVIERSSRPALYQRIADIALFLCGIFPDHASLFIAYPRTAFRGRRTLQDYETEGRRFYELAARETDPLHVRATCWILAEHFTLARHALNTLSDLYLKCFTMHGRAFPAG